LHGRKAALGKRFKINIPHFSSWHCRPTARKCQPEKWGNFRGYASSKIGDCLKEIEETEYWLELLVDSGCVSTTKMADLLDETRQLIAILTTIDKRSKGEP